MTARKLLGHIWFVGACVGWIGIFFRITERIGDAIYHYMIAGLLP